MVKHSKKSFYTIGIIILMCIIAFFFGLLSEENVCAEGLGVYFQVDKNPIERVEISSLNTTKTVHREEEIQLFTSVFPDNANKTKLNSSYVIKEGKQYATVKNEILYIASNAPIGTLIEIQAVVDQVSSLNTLKFTVEETFVQSLEFLNDETEIIIGSSLELKTKILPENATNQVIYYSVVKGSDIIQVSYNGIMQFIDGVAPEDKSTVKIRATVKNSNDKEIYVEKEFTVIKPTFEVINANLEMKSVEEQRIYSFSSNSEPYKSIFGDKAVYYSLNVGSDIATIDLNGQLYITPSAPLGQIFTIFMETLDGIKYQQELEVVPVYPESFEPYIATEPSVVYKGIGYYLPGDIIQIRSNFYPSNTSAINKYYSLTASDTSLASVDGIYVKVADIITDNNPQFNITVYTETVDENHTCLESNPIGINVYIPAEQIKIEKNADNIVNLKKNQNATELEEGYEYDLSQLINMNISPNNYTACEWNYKLISNETDDISIINGKIKIGNNLPKGEIKFGIGIEGKTYNSLGTETTLLSDTLYFDVYKQTRLLNISLQSTKNFSAANSASMVKIRTVVSKTASINCPTFTVTQGSDFIDGNISFSETDEIGAVWSFKLKQNLNKYISDHSLTYKPIKLSVTQDGKSNSLKIDFTIPDEELSLVPNDIDRGQSFTFQSIHSANATNKEIEWRIADEFLSQGVQVSTTNINTVTVPQKLGAGTEVKIEYRAKDKTFFGDNAPWKTVVYTIKTLINKSYSTVYGSNSIRNKGFNFVITNDSAGVAINKDCPQLMTGRNAKISIEYGDAKNVLSDWGMKIKNVYFSQDVATECGTRTSDTFGVKVNDKATHNAVFKMSVDVEDGDQTYKIYCEDVKVFRPLSGTLAFNTITKNNTKITDFINYGQSTFDFQANLGVADLKFKLRSDTGDGISLMEDGTLSVTSYVANKNFSITYENTTVQYYNVTNKITYSPNPYTITLKTVSLNNDGGIGRDYFIALDGIDTTSLKQYIPTKNGFSFLGYENYVDSNGTITMQFLDVKSLVANWEKVYKITIQVNDPNKGYLQLKAICHSSGGASASGGVHAGTPAVMKYFGDFGKGRTLTVKNGEKISITNTNEMKFTTALSEKIVAQPSDGYYFKEWSGIDSYIIDRDMTITAIFVENSCIASGTLITLANNEKVPVQDLTGDEQLLVWNLETGKFDSAPILFIDYHGESEYLVTKLFFEDGTIVDVIDEHGF